MLRKCGKIFSHIYKAYSYYKESSCNIPSLIHSSGPKERLQKKTADLVTLSKKGGRGQEKGKI